MSRHLTVASAFALAVLISVPTLAQEAPGSVPGAAPDLLTFAAGAIPVEVGGSGVAIGTSWEQAVSAVDGSPQGFTLHRRPASADTDFVFVYELPAATTFSRFAVPNVLEIPSPTQTFVAHVEVEGSTEGPTSGFVALASADLTAHGRPGAVTELTLAPPDAPAPAVRWVRVRLSGSLEEGATFVGFSELIGEGSQEAVAMVDHFDGVWDPRAGVFELHQEGAVVTGCVDDGRKTLSGTVSGNLLRAALTDITSGTRGAVILARTPDGALRGVRSDNGAPFRVFEGPVAGEGVTTHCSAAPTPTLGCGAVLHGIQFEYDSSAIRPESEPLIAALYEGISGIGDSTIQIVGHTSSEGSSAYNQRLSQERAAAVVAALEERGIAPGRLTAGGRGEDEPIADNETETGRSLNRRVEVLCEGQPGGGE